MQTRRKPDGTVTADMLEAAQAWSDFANAVEEMFPGYAVYGMDPGLVFRPTDPNRHDTFSLPTGACRALLQYVQQLGKSLVQTVPQQSVHNQDSVPNLKTTKERP